MVNSGEEADDGKGTTEAYVKGFSDIGLEVTSIGGREFNQSGDFKIGVHLLLHVNIIIVSKCACHRFQKCYLTGHVIIKWDKINIDFIVLPMCMCSIS